MISLCGFSFNLRIADTTAFMTMWYTFDPAKVN